MTHRLKKCKLCKTPYHSNYMNCTETRLMKKEGICFSCAFWLNLTNDKELIVINGNAYSLGKGDGGGFAGRRFDIRMNSGKEITTHDLWHRGEIPEHFRDRLKDNAVFLKGSLRW